MLETIYIDPRWPHRTQDELVEYLAREVEMATCRLMLRMWAAGLFTADGWTIMRVEQRGPDGVLTDIINLRPFNRHTRLFYKGE